MRILALMVVALWTGAAFAQDRPPAAPAKPAAQAKPKAAAAKPKTQSVAVRLQACMDHDDGTKERLDCYDAVIAPAPKPKPPAAKSVMDCRFQKEEDERLACFNGFVEKLPKLPAR